MLQESLTGDLSLSTGKRNNLVMLEACKYVLLFGWVVGVTAYRFICAAGSAGRESVNETGIARRFEPTM